jgi:hypothetical protein
MPGPLSRLHERPSLTATPDGAASGTAPEHTAYFSRRVPSPICLASADLAWA